MSAIAGIFFRNGYKVDPELMKKMNDKLSHRGPDESAVWYEGPIALGHQMLWTTEESLHEKLPFEEDGLVITADARIDNRKELSQELEIPDEENIADSYFILKAYQKWGENCPDKLLGDFAFAIWDKNKEKLFCARDHFGVKPFYYYSDREKFIFATELKAILCIPNIPQDLEYLKALYYLTSISNETTLTFYKDILRLPGNHSITIDYSNQKVSNYWRLDPKLEIIMDSNEEYVNAFLEVFNKAIKCRLRSSFPIGFELSGGLDSSSIFSASQNITNTKKDMNTFSLISNKFPEDDESFFIDIVLNSKVTNSHFLIVDPISPLKDVDNLMWHLEQPIPSPNMNLFWDLFKKMKKNNIRVAISGYDGDTVCYMGQFYLKELAFNLKLKKLIKEINSISKNKNEDYLNIIYSNIILPSIPLTIKKLWNKKQNKTLKDSILENDLIGSKFDFKKRYEELNLSSIQPKSSKKFHYKWLTLGTHQNAFEQLNKHFSAFSIEPRFPFFDKRVVEFCYGIPAEQKFQSGWNRLILRRSMENILPKSIQWRPRKRFFGSVFKNNFIRGEEKKLEEIIYELSDKYDIFVKKEDFERIYQRSKKKSNYSDIWDLWQLVTFVIWLEKNNIKIKNL